MTDPQPDQTPKPRKPKRAPDTTVLDEFFKELRSGVPDTLPRLVDLSRIPPEKFDEYDCARVTITPALQRYLASGDALTNHVIDQMEIYLEKAYGVADPFYITSVRKGSEENGDLQVDYFYLSREV